MASPLDEHGWLATLLAGATGAVAVWFRGWLKIRADLRGDHAETQIERGYSAAFDNLRGEVERLSVTVTEMSVELGRERAARREAEERAINAERMVGDLRARVAALELEIERIRRPVDPAP